MNKPKLSPQQQRVVHHREGPLLLIASAGNGKTRVLTERLRYLLEHKTGFYRILALTLTHKAADEIRGQLNEDDNGVYIGTLLKFCLQVIYDRGAIVGFEKKPQILERTEDRLDILRQAYESDARLQQYLRNNNNKKNFLTDVLDAISVEKRNLRSPRDGIAFSRGEESQLFDELYESYNELLINQNALDFDDIFMFTYRIFNESSWVPAFYRRLYRYICLDEAHYLNYAQYHIIKSLCGKDFRNVMLVSEPKPSFYDFLGASSDFMTQHFIQDFEVPVENQFKLTENYRFSKRIMVAANLLKPSSITETQALNGEVKALSFSDDVAEADWVINRLQTLIIKGHQDIEGAITWENCAVIGRTRYVMHTLAEKLQQHNIPYYYKRRPEAIVSESKFIQSFELGLHLLINPQNRWHFQKLLVLLNLKNLLTKIDEQNWSDGIELLTWIANHLPKTPFAQHFKILLTAWHNLTDDERRFRETLAVLEKYALETWLDDERAMVYHDIKMWADNWQNYFRQTENEPPKSFLTQVTLGANQSPCNGLTLLTVQNLLGLTFEVVCIMGMCEGTFPDYRALYGCEKLLEEEEHHVHKALTRSKRIVYFTYPRQKKWPWGEIKQQQPSRYLQKMGLEIKDNYMDCL